MNPTPSYDSSTTLEQFMPISSPFELNSPPPELPGLIGASVCSIFNDFWPVSVLNLLFFPDIIPYVTDMDSDLSIGQPILKTVSPMFALVFEFMSEYGRFVFSIFITDTSDFISPPINAAS